MDASSLFMKQFNDILKLKQDGGKKVAPKKPKTVKGEYKKKLATYNLEKIQRYCKQKGIKINKRVNGKLVNLTKVNLINKLANLKYK